MKTYCEKVKIVKEPLAVFCNACGEEIKQQRHDYCDIRWECQINISWQNHGSFPGQSSGDAEYHVCKECFTNKFEKLLDELEPNSKTYYQDDGTTVIKP